MVRKQKAMQKFKKSGSSYPFNISTPQPPPYQEFNIYFDKATGVLVEWDYTIDDGYFRITAVKTNLWSREPGILDWLLWIGVMIAIAVIVIALIIVVKRKKKPEQMALPPPPPPPPITLKQLPFFNK